MKCAHCKKTYPDEFNYCPYCAEPKPVPKEEEKLPEPGEYVEMSEKTSSKHVWSALALSFVSSIAFGALVIHFKDNMSALLYDFMSMMILPSFVLFFPVYWLIFFNRWQKKPHREKIIDYQFGKDQTSICPKCGSHNISLGRKGYDWSRAGLAAMLGYENAAYIGGEDSRRVTAYCNHCGHRWLTDQEWIR